MTPAQSRQMTQDGPMPLVFAAFTVAYVMATHLKEFLSIDTCMTSCFDVHPTLQIEPVAAQLPWMTAVGNHERGWPSSGAARGGRDSGGECGVAYVRRFRMPPPVWSGSELGGGIVDSFRAASGAGVTREASVGAADDALWYSFEFGPVIVIMFRILDRKVFGSACLHYVA